jgi:copper(I)-binding protein
MKKIISLIGLFISISSYGSQAKLIDAPEMPKIEISGVADYKERLKVEENKVYDFTISDPWVRMPAATSVNTAAYFIIKNNTKEDVKITDISSRDAISERVEIHGYKPDDNGVKKMFKLESVTIPAGSEVEFKPGSFHIMIMGLKKQIMKGGTYGFVIKMKAANESSKKLHPDLSLEFPAK